MDEKTFHGRVPPEELGAALLAHFNQGRTRAQWYRTPDKHVVVQIATLDGDATVTVTLRAIADGVNVALSQGQPWGAAASLAQTGASALFDPLSLIGRIGRIAEDIGDLTLPGQVWQAVDEYCRSAGAALGGSPEAMLVICDYCGRGNPPGRGECAACGAPIPAASQPRACPKCGQYVLPTARFCSRCGTSFVR